MTDLLKHLNPLEEWKEEWGEEKELISLGEKDDVSLWQAYNCEFISSNTVYFSDDNEYFRYFVIKNFADPDQLIPLTPELCTDSLVGKNVVNVCEPEFREGHRLRVLGVLNGIKHLNFGCPGVGYSCNHFAIPARELLGLESDVKTGTYHDRMVATINTDYRSGSIAHVKAVAQEFYKEAAVTITDPGKALIELSNKDGNDFYPFEEAIEAINRECRASGVDFQFVTPFDNTEQLEEKPKKKTAPITETTHSATLVDCEGNEIEIPAPDASEGWKQIYNDRYSWPRVYPEIKRSLDYCGINHLQGQLIEKEYERQLQNHELKFSSLATWQRTIQPKPTAEPETYDAITNFPLLNGMV